MKEHEKSYYEQLCGTIRTKNRNFYLTTVYDFNYKTIDIHHQ